MFFTIHSVLGLPEPDDLVWVDDVLTTLGGTDAPSGALVACTDSEARGHAVLLWPTREQAQRCADITGAAGAVRLGPGWVFEGTARPATSEGPCRYLQIVQFNGPRSAEWVARTSSPVASG
ncbi:MAG TPA: hypothetical protein VHN80_19285 [Kineosporiaceae bacterium]|nr:hypothetical protein [Kineosporiaceae bacterium]